MMPLAVVDTNVVVAALITADLESPTARILSAMLRGRFPYLLSEELIREYRVVLLRPRIASQHGLNAEAIDEVLLRLAAQGALRVAGTLSGTRGDEHLFALLATDRRALLVTGDAAALRRAAERGRTPAAFASLLA